eukprot:757413-Hanusia_phi.AAC.5
MRNGTRVRKAPSRACAPRQPEDDITAKYGTRPSTLMESNLQMKKRSDIGRGRYNPWYLRHGASFLGSGALVDKSKGY